MTRFDPNPVKSILDKELTFGRFEGCRWSELCQSYPSYVVWAIDNLSFLTEKDQDELYEMVDNLHGWDNVEDDESYEQYLRER